MLKNNELISIIVPVYNVELYLDRCVKSILNQTYKNIEVILVDDGSYDGSSKICDQWLAKDTRIKVIHQKNGGQSKARNQGIDIALGEYIMFVDSDDVIDENACYHLYQIINSSNNNDIAICELSHCFDNTPKFTYESTLYCLSKEDAINGTWYQKLIPSPCGKLYKKSLFKNVRFTEGITYEDVDILHRLYWECNSIVYNKSELYGYMHRENSVTTRPFSQRDLCILNIVENIQSFVSDKPNLKKAANAYTVSAAFRVYLNAPQSIGYNIPKNKSKQLIEKYGNAILLNKNVRVKSKVALVLYYLCKPILPIIHKKAKRWD